MEEAIQPNRQRFISDWNCDNPFAESLLGTNLFRLSQGTQSSESYIYFDQESPVIDAIREFHLRTEDLRLSRRNVLAGPGSSSFLAAFSIWLRRSGYGDIYYLPPLYHTFHYLLEIFDINATPISDKHAFEAGFALSLPQRHTVLLLCDPVWYAGKRLSEEQIASLAAWQRTTRSLIFVDGSFQYMQWDSSRSERSAVLDPGLTFRLVCPAKALAVPTFRFAYLLHPAEAHDELMFLYESAIGGASASDLVFARRALEVLNGELANQQLTSYLRNVYEALLARGLLRTTITPECGYFVFAVPQREPFNLLTMDSSFFELHGYDGYCRMNLMIAHRIYQLELEGKLRQL